MDFVTKVKALFTTLTESAKLQTVLLSTLGVLALGGLGVGGFTLYEQFYGPEAIVSAEVNSEKVETESVYSEMTETEEATEEVVTETETETETEVGPILVKLIGSSIEKDLKIKIQNEEERNVRGEDFCISVTPDKRNATASIYNDHDGDGIIYITDIDGGDYIVALEEIEGYYTEEDYIKVKVKEQIEYVKVEVKDEIKTEAEVSPEEDAESKDEVEVEAEIQDTVPWLDSKVTSTSVAASTIDKTPYLSAVASVGPNGEPVTVPANSTLSVASISYRNLFLVRIGTEGTVGTELPLTESATQQPTEAETQQPTEAETQQPTETETQQPTETETQQPTESETQQPTETETEDNPGSSETPDASQTPGDSNGGGTAVTITPATVTMPQTANLFASTRAAANTVEFAITINDTNATKLIAEANISWTVKNDTTGDGTEGSGIAVIGNGKSVKISSANSKKAGTAVVVATIPYKAGEKEGSVALECTVNVTSDSYDATIVLEDSAGDILYTDSACTNAATIADLVGKNVETFYKNPKYQGWQTLNGKLYYYGADNKPVTGQQTISGIMYDFGTDGALTHGSSFNGIDVSKYQTNIDWKTVKASGIDFVIIRVGYRGSATGVLVEDPYFKQHIKGATEAGLKVGVYFFTQAITKAEAVEEASMALALTEGYNLAYPIFIDTERVSGNARANNLDKATRTEIVDAFCKTIQNAGRKAGVYASRSWYNNQLNTGKLENYCIWVAQYNTECTYTGRYDIWQYTETGQVPGISGYVDLNISYMN